MGCYGGILLNGLFLKVFYTKKNKHYFKTIEENKLLLELIFIREEFQLKLVFTK